MLLKLFLCFLLIGTVSFGGGYGMISLIREIVVGKGWLEEEQLLSFIAVAESTPGPVAVNMATFIGSSQAGFAGAVVATLGVILPSFIIILIIAAVLKNILKYRSVNAFLSGVRPAVIALILSTALTMALSVFFKGSSFDWRSLIVLCLLLATHFLYKGITGKRISPIIQILISGTAGVLIWGLTG